MLHGWTAASDGGGALGCLARCGVGCLARVVVSRFWTGSWNPQTRRLRTGENIFFCLFKVVFLEFGNSGLWDLSLLDHMSYSLKLSALTP